MEPVPVSVRLVTEWATSFGRALKGARVYARNNAMYRRFVDQAHEGLTRVLDELGELTLSVREDRLLFENHVVYEDADLREGLPFILYNNAFRRITLLKGMSRDEMKALIIAFNADYRSLDFTSEDLVGALWRLRLPHLRYVTIDALSVTRSTSKETGDEDLRRLQADLEALVATLYRNVPLDEDVVSGLSLGTDDLEAIRDLRTQFGEGVDVPEYGSECILPDLPAEALEQTHAFLEGDDLDTLTHRMLGILARGLCQGRAGSAGSATLDLFQQIYDSLLLTHRYVHAKDLVQSLKARSVGAENIQEMHISRHLLRLLAAERRVLPILEGLNDGCLTVPISELVDFLRGLGPDVVPALLVGLASLDSVAHRKMVCELIVELGVPDVPSLEAQATGAKWFVVRDILQLARQHPVEQITQLVREALRHEHPKVRGQAVRILRDYGPGLADSLLAERLSDVDGEVRVLAARVAASRRPRDMLPTFMALLDKETFGHRDEEELRMVLGALAILGQETAVVPLAELLHRPFLDRVRNGVGLEVAAASALGRIPSEAARLHLQKGLRSLHSRVREACRRALTQSQRGFTGSRAEAASDAGTLEAFANLPGDTMSYIPEAPPPAEVPREPIPEAPSQTAPRREQVSRLLPLPPVVIAGEGGEDTVDLWPEGRSAAPRAPETIPDHAPPVWIGGER